MDNLFHSSSLQYGGEVLATQVDLSQPTAWVASHFLATPGGACCSLVVELEVSSLQAGEQPGLVKPNGERLMVRKRRCV